MANANEFPAPAFLRRRPKAGFWSRPLFVSSNHQPYVSDLVVCNGVPVVVSDYPNKV